MDEAVFIALKLAKSGLWGGNPQMILYARCDLVMDAVEHMAFLDRYESSMFEMNTERRGEK